MRPLIVKKIIAKLNLETPAHARESNLYNFFGWPINDRCMPHIQVDI